jgi:ubiquinone biosynthesis protein UbiJ
MITDHQVAAAKRLSVSLRFEDVAWTIARPVELVDKLQQRIEKLEAKRR